MESQLYLQKDNLIIPFTKERGNIIDVAVEMLKKEVK